MEHVRARGPGLGVRERRVEQAVCPLTVACDHERVGRGQQPSQPRRVIGRGRLLGRALREVGRRHHRSAGCRLAGRLLERSRDLLVRAIRRRGEMTCSLLRLVGQLGEPRVYRTPLPERRPLLHDRRDQRVAEAEPAAVAHDHVGSQCLLEPARRARRRRRRPRASAPPMPRRTAPRRACPPGARRHGGRAASGCPSSSPRPGARTISSARSGLPAHSSMQAREGGRRHPGTGPRVDEPPERPRVERSHGELDRLIGGQGADERGDRLVRRARAHRRDHLRAARLEAAQHERQHRRAGGVEPVPVVDREQDRARQLTQQRERGKPDLARVDRTRRRFEQQCGGQRAPLRPREPREPSDGRPEQVVERGERAARLGRGGPGPQHAGAGCLRFRHGGLEQRRLAHACVALEERYRRPPGSLTQSRSRWSSASRPTIASVVGMDIAVIPRRCVTLAVTTVHVKQDRVFWPCAVLRWLVGVR